MSKSSGLAVLALLIAIGALGLGIYQLIFASPQDEDQSGIKHTWTKFYYPEVRTNPASTSIIIDELTIDFTVHSGESVYFHFNTKGNVQAGTPSYVQLNFVLDGTTLSGPEYPWWSLTTLGDRILVPISCQLSLDTITAGNHNVTIGIFGNDNYNSIFSSTLLVQTYVS